MSFTTIPAAGAPLRASVLSALVTEVRPLYAEKGSNQIVANASTVLVDVTDLSVSVPANSTWDVSPMLIYDTATAADIRFGVVAPTGSAFLWAPWGLGLAATTSEADIRLPSTSTASVVVVGGIGVGTLAQCRPMGVLTVGANAGTFKIQSAQGTSNASNTTVWAGSTLVLHRVD